VFLLNGESSITIWTATLPTGTPGILMSPFTATSSDEYFGYGLVLNPTATDLYYIGRHYVSSSTSYTDYGEHCAAGGSCNTLNNPTAGTSGASEIGNVLYVGGYVFYDISGTLTRYQPSTNQSTTLTGVTGKMVTDGTYVYYNNNGTIVRITPSTMATQNTVQVPSGYIPLASDGIYVYSSANNPTQPTATTVTATPFAPIATQVLNGVAPYPAALVTAGGFLIWAVSNDVDSYVDAMRFP
jgi:hypothetical protein